jgi:hypothetical protein
MIILLLLQALCLALPAVPSSLITQISQKAVDAFTPRIAPSIASSVGSTSSKFLYNELESQIAKGPGTFYAVRKQTAETFTQIGAKWIERAADGANPIPEQVLPRLGDIQGMPTGHEQGLIDAGLAVGGTLLNSGKSMIGMVPANTESAIHPGDMISPQKLRAMQFSKEALKGFLPKQPVKPTFAADRKLMSSTIKSMIDRNVIPTTALVSV